MHGVHARCGTWRREQSHAAARRPTPQRAAPRAHGRVRVQTAPTAARRVLPLLQVPTGRFYGFATFNLSYGWGQSSAGPYNTAYGHLGATYGYQSIVAYFPAADVSVSIASNIELDDQIQPADTLCIAYNAVLAHLTNATEPQCTFTKSDYYGGTCDCGNDYVCHRLFKKCVKAPRRGSLSHEDCTRTCGEDADSGSDAAP